MAPAVALRLRRACRTERVNSRLALGARRLRAGGSEAKVGRRGPIVRVPCHQARRRTRLEAPKLARFMVDPHVDTKGDSLIRGLEAVGSRRSHARRGAVQPAPVEAKVAADPRGHGQRLLGQAPRWGRMRAALVGRGGRSRLAQGEMREQDGGCAFGGQIGDRRQQRVHDEPKLGVRALILVKVEANVSGAAPEQVRPRQVSPPLAAAGLRVDDEIRRPRMVSQVEVVDAPRECLECVDGRRGCWQPKASLSQRPRGKQGLFTKAR